MPENREPTEDEILIAKLVSTLQHQTSSLDDMSADLQVALEPTEVLAEWIPALRNVVDTIRAIRRSVQSYALAGRGYGNPVSYAVTTLQQRGHGVDRLAEYELPVL